MCGMLDFISREQIDIGEGIVNTDCKVIFRIAGKVVDAGWSYHSTS